MLTSFVCNQSMKAFGQPRSILILISLLFVVGLLGYRLELSFPTRAPKLDNTYTPQTKPAPQEVGSYDVLEGAPNNDVNTGLLQAFATNSAAMFRQTRVNPTTIAAGDRTYINAVGQTANLPDANALAKFPRFFTSPQTYPANVSVPLPTDPPILDIPVEISPRSVRELSYAIGDPAGGL